MRYLDTGSRESDQTLYAWLKSVLPGANYFGCQTGYFSFDGIFPVLDGIEAILQSAGTVHLVIGANEAGVRLSDIEDVLTLFESASTSAICSLTLVAAEDLLMHPKTYYVEQMDGTKHSLVGSVNLTHAGLSRNIEAALAIDSKTDPGGPFSEIKTAIERWGTVNPPNAYPVTRNSLEKLLQSGLLDVERVPTKTSPRLRKNREKIFPKLGGMLKLPRKKRKVTPTVKVRRVNNPKPAPVGTLNTLENGQVGIVKRLSGQDVKGFRDSVGTPYIALPAELSSYLPMAPAGKNLEPRLDVVIEVRMEGAPNDVADSGISPTNITFVGVGERKRSNPDLRLNYLTTIRNGVMQIAEQNSLAYPQEGDLVAIELLEGPLIRLTFISDGAVIGNLTPLLDQPGESDWGWLPAGVVGAWDELES